MIADHEHQLSNALSLLATALERGSESIRAVTTAEENRFSRALRDLRELAQSEQIPLAIVGGLGAIRFGYHAASPNIEVVAVHAHLAHLLQMAPRYGLEVACESATGWHTLIHGDVEIILVPEGGKANRKAPTSIPSPAQLGVTQGLDYACLAGWIELKLGSGWQKDRADIVEVMKKSTPGAIQEARTHIASVHEAYVALFDQLLDAAQQEREQEGERGH